GAAHGGGGRRRDPADQHGPRRHPRGLRPRPDAGGLGGGRRAGDRLGRGWQPRAPRGRGHRRAGRRGACGEHLPFRRVHGAAGEGAHAQPGHRGAAVSWLDEVPWNEHDLVAVVTQEAHSGRVLTVAWMNREALQRTAETNEAVYWSRSRKKLWRKGEESGNVQK